MGMVKIPLSTLRKRKPVRRWYPLGDKDAKLTGKLRGELDLQLRWRHNPINVEKELELTVEQALVLPQGERRRFRNKSRNEVMVTVVRAKNLAVMDQALIFGQGSSDPIVTVESSYAAFPAQDWDSDKPPNEVKVKLHAARNLPIMDKNLLSKGGSSDPFVQIKCGGDTAKSSTKTKSLNPVWDETHTVGIGSREDVVEIVVMDYDKLSGNDFMGGTNFPLAGVGRRSEEDPSHSATHEQAADEVRSCWRWDKGSWPRIPARLAPPHGQERQRRARSDRAGFSAAT